MHSNTLSRQKAGRLAVLALAICSACFASEKIVTATGTDFSNIQKMLDDGWTVKAQSSVVAKTYNMAGGHDTSELLHVFTLAAPSDFAEREAKRAADAKAAFDRKRAEWLAKQPKVEKP
jgi:uncharacterized protein YcnI